MDALASLLDRAAAALRRGRRAMGIGGVAVIVGIAVVTLLIDALESLVAYVHSGAGDDLYKTWAFGALGLLMAVAGVAVLGRPPRPPRAAGPPSPRRGLVVMVSGQPAVLKAFERHEARLERVWLIASLPKEPYGDGTEELAKQIRDQLALLAPNVRIKIEPVLPDDPRATFDAVNRIYRSAAREGIPEHEMIADFTGGLKPMAFGMIAACLREERALQYVPYDPQAKRSLDPVAMEMSHGLFGLEPS